MPEKKTSKPLKKSNEKITWKLVTIDSSRIKPNPNNPKKINKAGTSRLKKIIERFGMVFDGICNKDLTLIDGHSRRKLSKNKKARVFVPSRQLSAKEYLEMNAVYDLARAGEPDELIIEKVMGEAFLKEWSIGEKKEKSTRTVEFEVDPNKTWYLKIKCKSKLDAEAQKKKLSKQGYDCKLVN